jgi:mannose-1-phosphate guanylyltransferase
LLDEGALWNAFIIVSSAQALLDLYVRRYPEIVNEMGALLSVQRNRPTIDMNLVALYQRLPELDFSRHILQGQEAQLRVIPVPNCGWTDLGTPKRVGDALRKVSGKSHVTELHAHLNLALQHERMQLQQRAAS